MVTTSGTRTAFLLVVIIGWMLPQGRVFGNNNEERRLRREFLSLASKSSTGVVDCSRWDVVGSGETCIKGLEIGEECTQDQQCFSEACLVDPGGKGSKGSKAVPKKMCACRNAADCMGCQHSKDAPCLRVEIVAARTPFEFCMLQVVHLQTEDTAVNLFSKSSKGKSMNRRRALAALYPFAHPAQDTEPVPRRLASKIKGKSKGKGGRVAVDTFDLGAARFPGYESLQDFERFEDTAEISRQGVTDKKLDCITLEPFLQGNLPAFVQTSVYTAHPEKDVDVIDLAGSPEGIAGAQLYLAGEFVTFVPEIGVSEQEDDIGVYQRDDHKSKASKASSRSSTSYNERALDTNIFRKARYNLPTTDRRVIVHVWKRRTLASWGQLKSTIVSGLCAEETLVVKVKQDTVLDFDIPPGCGVELVGQDSSDPEENFQVNLNGEVSLGGRLTVENLFVSFELGSLVNRGIFLLKDSLAIDLDRCPHDFKVIGGQCVSIPNLVGQRDDATDLCSGIPRAYSPRFEELMSPSLIAEELLRTGRRVWLSSNTHTCEQLTTDGTVLRGVDCDEFLSVLCVAAIKNTITEGRYTSYFSGHVMPSYSELFARLSLPAREIPFQLGGTLSVLQTDVYEEDDGSTPVTFSVSDERPVQLKFEVVLSEGDPRDLRVALDTFEELSDSDRSGSHYFQYDKDSSMPSRVQVHTTGPVCLERVDMFLFNATGHSQHVLSIPTSIFEQCLDLNVCSADNEDECGRSLMYYDHDKKCARLGTQDAKIPRDFSFHIFPEVCSRLTSWSHPDLGESFQMQVDYSLSPQTDISLLFPDTDIHQYIFSPRGARSLPMDESNRVPIDFTLSGGEGSRIEQVRIARYGRTISQVNFATSYDCINLCAAIADELGVFMGSGLVQKISLKLLDPVECRRVIQVTVDNTGGDQQSLASGTLPRFSDLLPSQSASDLPPLLSPAVLTGREICTSPPLQVVSSEEMELHLSELSLSTSDYRTLRVAVPTLGFRDFSIDVPDRRGLILFFDFDASSSLLDGDPFLEDSFLSVGSLSEVVVEDLIINGTSSFGVASLGYLEVSGGSIRTNNRFLVNEGETVLTSSKVQGSTLLTNGIGGFTDLVYVSLEDESLLENNDRGTFRVSRLQLYENFPNPFDLGGSLQFPDALRFYEILDNESNELCLGDDVADASFSVTVDECQDLCEDEFTCSGILFSFEEETNEPLCELCLKGEPCKFECGENKRYYFPSSKFYYTSVSACPIFSREIETIPKATLEECKLLCSYYTTCEGFRLEASGGDSACILMAELDFISGETCTDEKEYYIPFTPTAAVGYAEVDGGLLVTAPPLLNTVPNLPKEECSAVCEKYLFCKSFIVQSGACSLYAGREYARTASQSRALAASSDDQTLLPSVADSFPKKLYMVYDRCVLSGWYQRNLTKTPERCKKICSGNYGCSGFAWFEFADFSTENCYLYERAALANRVFGGQSVCELDPLNSQIFVAFAVETYVQTTGRTFVAQAVVEGLLEDECKSLCFHDVDCVALQYDINGTCAVGTLMDGDRNDDAVLSLSGASADFASQYIRTEACYSGEPLTYIDGVPEKGSGFVQFPRICTLSAVSYSSDSPKSVAECSLDCLSDPSCVGFQYYVDYGGGQNTDKFGTCDFISEVNMYSCPESGGEANADLYLRSDIGGTCEAACNIHQLCSAFVFNDNLCMLFSDIALRDECPQDDSKVIVNIGLAYRERDAMVSAPRQCLVEFEELAISGCVEATNDFSVSGAVGNSDDMTLYACQQVCRSDEYPLYAVTNGDTCNCAETVDVTLVDNELCNSTCTGDTAQYCGGDGHFLVGSTQLSLVDVTLPGCKRACFESNTCEAIKYNSGRGECELRNSARFQKCEQPSEYDVYIKSLEHYYDVPLNYYLGDSVVHTTTTALRQNCQKLCDAFANCTSIRFDQAKDTMNCEILGGGSVVRSGNGTFPDGVEEARDVTLFTRGFGPDSATKVVDSIANIFDLDECRALCEESVECGSFIFKQQTCTMYEINTFADTTAALPNDPFYIDYKGFVDVEQEFVQASGLCLRNEESNVVAQRKTTQSEFDCARRCNREFSCTSFTFAASVCTLYDDGATLTNECVDGQDLEPYIMFTRGKFTRRDGACLLNEHPEGDYTFERKSLAECAALCDKWFNCRSFRSEDNAGMCRLFSNEQYSVDSCSGHEAAGDLYVYYSDFYYANLGSDFCVAANSFLSFQDDTPLEACKKMCDLHTECLAFEHSQDGICAIYQSSDFSEGCTSNPGRRLYIGYRYLIDLSREAVAFTRLQNCFDFAALETATVDLESDCAAKCMLDTCFGYQFSFTEGLCGLLDSANSFPPLAGCAFDSVAKIRTAANPYKKMESTCLRNKIDLDGLRLENLDYYGCVALCDAHPFCRYFLYGRDPDRTTPALRECVLFEAQGEELEFDQDKCPEDNAYRGLEATVNGRTFIDQVTWFGEPEETFAVIGGVSYQECAALCDSMDICLAFLHTWNYRRAPSNAGRPQIFTRSRLMRADVDETDAAALFLQFDLDASVLTVSTSSSDDDERRQSVLLEFGGGGGDDDDDDDAALSTTTFKLRFWSSSGFCIAAGDFAAFPESHTRDVIESNFDGAVPSCQQLGISQCTSNQTIEFRLVDGYGNVIDDLNSLNGLGVALEYSLPGVDSPLQGCLRIRADADAGERDYQVTNPAKLDGDLEIPIETNCTEILSMENCTIVYEYNYANATSAVIDAFLMGEEVDGNASDCNVESNFSQVNGACLLGSSVVIGCDKSEGCVDSAPIPVQDYRYESTNETSRTCKVFHQRNCASSFSTIIQTFSSPTNDTLSVEYVTETVECVQEIDVESTICWHAQKTAVDLLEDMFQFFQSSDACRQPVSSSGFGVVSSSYGPGCGFDNSIVTFRNELLSFASEAVALSHDASRLCLETDLSLDTCTRADTTEWIYMFESGKLFYVTDNGVGDMKCLSRDSDKSDATLFVKTCSTRDGAMDTLQRWKYNGDLGRIELPDGNACLISSNNTRPAELGSCTAASARWSRYSECRLNTRDRTSPMKLESFDDRGRCIRSDGEELGDCDGGGIGEWQYYYESDTMANGQLRRVTPPQQVCLGRKGDPDSLDVDKDLVDFDTGVTQCGPEFVAFNLLTLSGDEGNIFTWYDPLSETKALYCVNVPNPSDQQQLCDPDLEGEDRWRKYGDEGDATEISVRPDLTISNIDDPEILFQFFLFRAEGKTSRILRALTASLGRDIERAVSAVLVTMTVLGEASGIADQVAAPIDRISRTMDRTELVFKSIKTVITPFQYFPYGPPIRSSRIRTIAGQIANQLKAGTRSLDAVDKLFDRTVGPMRGFSVLLSKLFVAFQAFDTFDTIVNFITRAAFCSWFEGNIEFFETLQGWVQILTDVTKSITGLVASLDGFLGPFNRFKTDVTDAVMNALGVFNGLLSPLIGLADALGFILVLDTFFIPFVIASFSIDKKCWTISFKIFRKRIRIHICIPWPRVEFRTVKLTLKMLSDLLAKIERVIRSIPLVGALWSVFEKAITFAVGLIFKIFNFQLPTFSLNVPFLNTLEERIDEATDFVDDLVDKLTNIELLGGAFDDFFGGLRSKILAFLPSGLSLDLLPFDCPDGSCITKALGIELINTDIPGIRLFDSIDVTIPQEFVDLQDAIETITEDIAGDIGELFSADVKCSGYETVELDVAYPLLEGLGLNASAVGVTACPISFQICNDFELEGIEKFTSSIESRLETVGIVGAVGGGRRLSFMDDVCADAGPFQGGLVIPIDFEYLRSKMNFFSISTKFSNFFKLAKTAIIGPKCEGYGFSKDAEANSGLRCRIKNWLNENAANIGRSAADLYGDNPSFWIELNPSNFKQVFNPQWRFVLGCRDGRFAADMKMGPFVKVVLGFESNTWGSSRHAEKALTANYFQRSGPLNRQTSASRKKFHDESVQAISAGAVRCDLEYIYATHEIMSRPYAPAQVQRNLGDMLEAEERKAFFKFMEPYIQKWQRDVPDRDNLLNKLLDLAATEFRDLQKEVSRWKDFSDKYRAVIQGRCDFAANRCGETGNSTCKTCIGTEFDFFSAFKTECSGPEPPSVDERSILTRAKELLFDPKETLSLGAEWAISALKKYEFHPTHYANLFGSGVVVQRYIHEIRGDFTPNKYEFKIKIDGPLPTNTIGAIRPRNCENATRTSFFQDLLGGNENNTVAEGIGLAALEALYSLYPYDLVVWTWNWFRSLRYRNVPELERKSSLIAAMRAANTKEGKDKGDDHKTFAYRSGLTASLAFGGARIAIWPPRDFDDKRPCRGILCEKIANRFCIGLGFNADAFFGTCPEDQCPEDDFETG